MGEYEPDDSRNVTLTDNRAPGEPPRTGPREASTRRDNDASRQQQSQGGQGGQQQSQASSQAGQAQQQGGQTQRQDSSSQAEGLWGNDAPRAAPAGGPTPRELDRGDPERQEMEAQPGGPLAGNQPQAIDSPAGSPEPVYDQYEVNQPQNMHQPGGDDLDRLRRRQAGEQEGATGGFGYGADGEETMADAPGSDEVPRLDEDGRQPADRERGEASGAGKDKAEYDRR